MTAATVSLDARRGGACGAGLGSRTKEGATRAVRSRPHVVDLRSTSVRRPRPSVVHPLPVGRPSARPVRLTRRGRLLLSVACLTVGTFAAINPLGGSFAAAGANDSPRVVTVERGDTLWSLVAAWEPGVSPRNAVAEAIRMNSLTSDQVHVGQTLYLPRR